MNTSLLTTPPGPEQVNEYDELDVIGLVFCLPLVGLFPVHLPEATQVCVPVESQVRSVVPLVCTDVVSAVRTRSGCGAAPTVTLTDCTAVPPGPEQVSVN